MKKYIVRYIPRFLRIAILIGAVFFAVYLISTWLLIYRFDIPRNFLHMAIFGFVFTLGTIFCAYSGQILYSDFMGRSTDEISRRSKSRPRKYWISKYLTLLSAGIMIIYGIVSCVLWDIQWGELIISFLICVISASVCFHTIQRGC